MKINMTQWIQDTISSPVKKAMPILSFPGVQITGHTVEEMVRDGHLQAECMKAVADRFDTGAAFSLMDLSVEAEAFGSPVHYSEDEVPTVTAALVHDEDEAEALQVPEVGAGRTGECVKGIREVTEMITDRPVLAGIIGPFSLAGRILDMTEIMILCYEEPEMVETVLGKGSAASQISRGCGRWRSRSAPARPHLSEGTLPPGCMPWTLISRRNHAC